MSPGHNTVSSLLGVEMMQLTQKTCTQLTSQSLVQSTGWSVCNCCSKCVIIALIVSVKVMVVNYSNIYKVQASYW